MSWNQNLVGPEPALINLWRVKWYSRVHILRITSMSLLSPSGRHGHHLLSAHRSHPVRLEAGAAFN
jgi:hypothetical protein